MAGGPKPKANLMLFLHAIPQTLVYLSHRVLVFDVLIVKGNTIQPPVTRLGH